MTRRAAPAFVLASGSAGRLRVLRQAGIDPEVVVSGADETAGPGLGTAALVTVLAERKAAAVAARRPDALVLGGAELTAYVGTGEPMQLAGAFSIEGRGAPFIEGVTGDPGNVIGLSLPLLRRMLARAGLTITSLWRADG